MKKTLLILAFVLSLILAFSIVSLASETENTYYVVESEDSALAGTLKEEGKNVVGISKLYTSASNSIAENTTYFISQFEGQTLNLILAENVSYSTGNDTGPRATGIRIDKAVTVNVYFNGHSWWIPDDNNYSGFFVNHEDASLTLIGNRTIEEVSAPLDLSNVSAKSKSDKIDYYGGFVGIYVETGDLTIKNAVIAGHDEIIYQRESNARGTSTITFDTCRIKIKASNYDPITFIAKQQATLTIKFNHLYTDDVKIHNVMGESYINNSSINTLYMDSWRADRFIGKDYVEVNNSTINSYTAAGDTQHLVAKNTAFGSVNLMGDSTGGAYLTIYKDCTYTSISLVNSSQPRQGTLYVVSDADCENAGTRTVTTYNGTENVTSIDEEYSKANPAFGHSTENNPVSITYTSYLEAGKGLYICDACAKEFFGELESLFTCVGYSVYEGNDASVTIGYKINASAIELYEAVTKDDLRYGIYAVAKDKLGDNDIFTENGPSNGVLSAEVTEYIFQTLELKIVNISDKYKDAKLALGAYVSTTDGQTTTYSYLQYGDTAENEKYTFVSFNEIVDSLPPEILSFENIELGIGQSVDLPKTAFVNGAEKALTYTFDSSNISIENGVLTGLGREADIKVNVTGKGVKGEFLVSVVDLSKYKHVVIIGVDGAGTYFKDASTPNLDNIFANGALTYDCLTSNPTISAQCWGSLLHGVIPSVHGLTNDNTATNAYPSDSSYPSFFRVIRENNENAVLASFAGWNPINIGIVENDIGVHKEGGMSDALLTESILAYLAQNNPDAMFVQFDEADSVGHSSGYGTDAQLAKIAQIDEYIGEIYNAYAEKGILDETLFIVTADHGGNGTSHGGLTDSEKYVMFAAAGKNVVKGTIGDMEIRDTASIVLHALGYECPITWSARVPSNLFDGVEAPSTRPGNVPGRYHESEPTPVIGSSDYVTNFVDKELSVYLPFDGNAADNCGGKTTSNNTVTYTEGYFGQGATLNKGYVSLDDLSLGNDSFTISLWINSNTLTSDPCILSNKNWDSGANTGFALAIRKDNGGDIRINYAEGGKRIDLDKSLPADYVNGWVHIIVIVDRENHQLGACMDFGTIKTGSIPQNLQGTNLDTQYSYNIGQDGRGTYGSSLPATVDEFMIFKGAFTQEDVAALAQYYGMTE
ncbi:MAG: alkaline phosphatase family protein [Clostridia bacterium]|nr:alkaline phosphatase family protein [Clostridia bacterium]